MSGPVEARETAAPIEGRRVEVKGRILVGGQHLDVAAEYHDGPVPCIVERERFVADELLPLTVAMLEDVVAYEQARRG